MIAPSNNHSCTRNLASLSSKTSTQTIGTKTISQREHLTIVDKNRKILAKSVNKIIKEMIVSNATNLLEILHQKITSRTIQMACSMIRIIWRI